MSRLNVLKPHIEGNWLVNEKKQLIAAFVINPKNPADWVEITPDQKATYRKEWEDTLTGDAEIVG